MLNLALNYCAAASRSVGREPKDVALSFEELVDLQEPDVVFHDGTELLEGGLLHDGSDARERLAHDGNKQVQED